MSTFFIRRAAPVGALLLSLCSYAADRWSIAYAESSAPPQPEDVVRLYGTGLPWVNYQYAYQPLEDALGHSVARYGRYKAEPITTEMDLTRLKQEALKGDLINVVVLPPGQREMDEGLIPIDIPLDKGLWGYRVSFIRATDQSRIDQVRDIAGLRQLRLGLLQPAVKVNVPIYKYNDIDVVTDARNYDSLLEMLERGRFDLIPRPAPTVFDEYDSYVRSKHPSLAIDQHLLIHFPYPLYVYVSKSAPRLAERIRYGLQEMQKDGSLDKDFEEYFSPMIAKLNFSQRTLIELEDPFLPDWAKLPKLEWR